MNMIAEFRISDVNPMGILFDGRMVIDQAGVTHLFPKTMEVLFRSRSVTRFYYRGWSLK
jgi:hypothetical protein